MEMVSVKDYAAMHGMAERTVRNYCKLGKINGAILVGKSWVLPCDAAVALRTNARVKVFPLLSVLREQMKGKVNGGIYHRIQIDLTYNSNHIEGSRLTKEQTRYIFETNTIGIDDEAVNVDDIIEATNHFRCIDYIIEHATEPLSESMIKELHRLLKSGTSDASKSWFAVGDYKRLPNEVGGMETVEPEKVGMEIRALIREYKAIKNIGFDDILNFHHRIELIHPFQDGNGRVGRLIMFKECLRLGIVPFIITDDMKMFYYRGLREWKHLPGYLRDTCLTAQDNFKVLLNYFRIKY
ncbi:MAG: Fic family protein [Muribaculaceae bacterium]